MAKFYFYKNGKKSAAVSAETVKELAVNGVITPDTIIEAEDGKQTKAENLKGLKFHIPVSENNDAETVEGLQKRIQKLENTAELQLHITELTKQIQTQKPGITVWDIVRALIIFFILLPIGFLAFFSIIGGIVSDNPEVALGVILTALAAIAIYFVYLIVRRFLLRKR